MAALPDQVLLEDRPPQSLSTSHNEETRSHSPLSIDDQPDQLSSHGQKSPSSSPPISRIGVNTNKAGMEGLDKTKINQIILEASKGSKYYENELQREKKVTERITAMLKDLKKLTASEKHAAQTASDKDIEYLEMSRDLGHIVVHIDMDAFYAAVEMRDNPSLRDVPMAVGSNSMLSTSNYLARRFGVRAAMPGFIGKKLCPNLVIVKPNFSKYQEVSHLVREILAEYDPQFSPMGLDEAYLDLTDYVTNLMTKYRCWRPKDSSECNEIVQSSHDKDREKMFTVEESMSYQDSTDNDVNASPQDHLLETNEQYNISAPMDCSHSASCNTFEVVEGGLPYSYWECALHVVTEVRHRIHEITQLTASAGIAVNKMLAKIASDMNKPNGQFLVEPTREGILHFTRALPIRKISGIGKVTEKMLNALGVQTCQDLYDQRAILRLLFSKASSYHFLRISIGSGSSVVHSDWERKSISTERTFSDVSDPEELLQKCYELCQSLAEEIAAENIQGRTVTLKMKTSHFEVKQRSMSFPHLVHLLNNIHKAAKSLLQAEIQSCHPSPLRLRLMGVRLSALESGGSPCKRKRVNTLENFFPLEMDSNKKSKIDITSEDDTSNDSFTQLVPSTESFSVCPICETPISGDNVILNQHIDECLNHSTIEQFTNEAIIVSNDQQSSSTSSTTTTISHANSKGKKKPSKSPGIKLSTDQSRTPTKKPRVLETFFK